MNLNSKDCLILESALEELLSFIQKNAQSLPTASAANIVKNTSAIKSVRKKLKQFSKNPQQHFSMQELKVMYWALHDFLETAREFLADSPITDPDRETALDTQRTCSRLLRYFESLFAQDGIDIRKLFDDE